MHDNSQTIPTDRIALTINALKTKLLDLTKRNRALNFKPTEVSTVTIVDEQPPEIFRLLCLENKTLKFKAKPETASPKTSGEGGVERKSENISGEVEFSAFDGSEVLEETGDEYLADDAALPDFTPYDAATLADQRTDDYLQTNAAPEQLDKSLRRLEEQARSSLEEQGVNSLFLALGMLQYNESRDSQGFYKAPLILVPVELARSSARAGYKLKKTDDEALVNPSIVEYLRRNYSIALPELPDLSELTEGYDLQNFFLEVGEAAKGQKDWAVKSEIQLALFSFQKLVMYKDIEKNAANLAAHPIINKIITRDGDHFAALPDDVREMELDRDFAPEATAQVVDADSSQLRAIAAVAKNYDLVLEGPPGTGKSQTITNLIAQSLSAGKSVLFVAEKWRRSMSSIVV